MPKLNTPTLAKSYHVRSDLMERIRCRKIRVGDCIPSEPQLVSELGVSRGTVRRAIRDLVRDGIVETRAGVGHVVRSARPRKTVGLLFGNDYFRPFHRLVLEAFEDELRQRGFSSRLYVARFVNRSHVVDHTQFVKDLRKGRLAGVLTVSWSDKDSAGDRALGKLMRTLGVPCVPITNVAMPAAVGGDPHSVTYQGTKHLLARGCRRIGLMFAGGGPEQVEGYHHALHEAGVEAEPELCCDLGDPGEAAAFDTFKRWWHEAGPFTGVVICDDLLAKGAVAAAVDLGLDIPGELRVAALAHAGSDIFIMRPYTRLEMDASAYARKAIEHLQAMLDDPANPPEQVYLKVQLIEEASEQPVTTAG